MNRIIAFVSSLFAVAAALVSTGSAAFAMRIAPPTGGSSVDVAPVIHHSAGLEPWQVALVAVAGVVVLIAAVLAARLITRSLHRSASAPATA